MYKNKQFTQSTSIFNSNRLPYSALRTYSFYSNYKNRYQFKIDSGYLYVNLGSIRILLFLFSTEKLKKMIL